MSADYNQLLDRLYENLPEKAKGTGERWEAPKFEFFVEGNKTIIRNFSAVVDKIRRDGAPLIKFLSKELAVPIALDSDRLVLHRKMAGNILNKKLEEFIQSYVLCKECKKPDTHIQDAGHGLRQLVCEACGAKQSIR